MSNYTRSTNFTAKDALTTGNPSKIILGSEHDAEYDAIATAIATKLDSNGSAANLTALPAAQGGACAFIQKEDGSTAATYDFALDLTNYGRHIIYIDYLKPATDNVEFWGRVSSDDITYQTTFYRWSRHNLTDSSTEGLAGSTSDSKFLMANAVGNQDGEQINGTIEITSAGGMGVRVLWRLSGENAAGSYYMATGMGVHAGAAYTYFRLMFSSGNIATGTARMYGFKRA